MEYPTDDSESPQAPASQRGERLSSFLFSGLKILVTGIAIPILVSVATSFYVNTHLLKPKLRADYSWGEVMVMPVERHPNEFVAALVDLYPGFRATLPSDKGSLEELDKPLDFTGGEITTAKHLIFKSEKDYVIDSSPTSSRIMKIMLVNNGYATATHINMGLHFLNDSMKYKIIPSPNIRIAEEAVAGIGVNPAFVKISIDRLGASEKALMTVVCGGTSASSRSPIDSFFLILHQNIRYEPILYVSSDEGGGTISPEGISLKDATNWEEANFPDSVIGFWASRIHPKTGISPSVEDMKEPEIDYELVSDSGKHTGNGTLKMSPRH